MSGVALKVQGLQKQFNSRQVLSGIEMEFKAGTFHSILGPSGCGKSTFLRLLAGLEEPTVGNILRYSELKTSFVFQEPQLLPWRTAAENILLPLELEQTLISAEEKKSKLQKALSQVQLPDAGNLYPDQLSGGMKMRVSLARALITDPDLLLLDEPFSALDEEARFAMQDLLLKIWQEKKMTVVFVTHSLSEAVYLSQRVIRWGKKSELIFDETVSFRQERSGSLRTSAEFNQRLEALR